MTSFELKGNRVMLVTPLRPERAIELSPETEKAMERELVKKWTSLEVAHVGDDLTDRFKHLKAGDKVYVEADSLGRAGKMVIDDKPMMIIRDMDIILIWK